MDKLPTIAITAVIAALVGAGSVWWWLGQRDTPAAVPGEPPAFDRLFNDDFFSRNTDPFGEMERIRKEMRDLMPQPSVFDERFDTWFEGRFDTFSKAGVEQEDEGDTIAWRIDTGDQSVSEAAVNVKDGYVIISAEAERKNDNRVAVTTIRQQFPVPANVEPQTARIEREDNEIVVRFDKTQQKTG